MGIPLFIIISLLTIICFHYYDVELSAIGIEVYRLSATPTLMAIPMFTFSGFLIAASEAPNRLFKLFQEGLGWFPGGIALMSLILVSIFTAFTGASGITIIALGGVIYPILIKNGYSDEFATGFVSTSGSLGLLFAPSLPLILYGIIANVSIDDLFLAGIAPGILIIFLLYLFTVFSKNSIKRTKFSKERFIAACREAKLEIPLGPLVLGGIYSGLFTAVEASTISVFYCVFVLCFLRKDLSFKEDIPRVMSESMMLVGSILIILCSAMGLTNFLIDEEIPMKALAFISEIVETKIGFLILLNIFLLIIGCVMDIYSAIIVIVPLIIPIATKFDVHPIHLAMIFLTNLEIGYLTPPVGINLFISSYRFNKPIEFVYRSVLPYLVVLIIALLIITYIPELSLLWVP